MTTDAFFAALFEALLLPPGLSLSLLTAAYWIPHEPTKTTLYGLGYVTLYLSSIPATTAWIRSKLEIYPTVDLDRHSAKAIVVLGADRYIDAPEYAGDTLRGFGLERVRYAAWLHKRTGLPILVSGGAVLGETLSEAELMGDLLSSEFHTEVRWQEGESKTTYENALYSSRILKNAGITRVLLVTHAWAMPRALEAFKKAGIEVTPAPTGYLRRNDFDTGLLAWLPSASAVLRTHLALHEVTGRLWYRLRYF